LQKKAELKVPGKTPIPEAGGKAGVMGTSDSKTTRPAKDLSDPVVGKTREGKPVFEGTQMGFYYLNDDGKRVYVNEFEGVKIVGKTSDGKNIYEGLRGGHFYFNDDGNKVYVKR
jgi:hypothetical protein